MQNYLPSFNDDIENLWSALGLTHEQKNQLASLTNSKGEPLFSKGISRELNYATAAWIHEHDFDSVYRYLWDNRNKSVKDLLFSAPVADKIRKRYEEEIDSSVFKPREASGIYVCPKCKSDKVRTLAVQLRSADEPFTIFANCTTCAHGWNEE